MVDKEELYKVKIEKKALKQLKKMDRFQARIIYDWIMENLEDIDDPRKFGKGLTSNRSGEWRYRVGDYRILAIIKEDTILISVFEIGHRRDIY
jgi:mRNA interferase RelE/StbE